MSESLHIDPTFNEHDVIAKRGSDHISHIIYTSFDPHKDLLFCLVEHVTLGNVTGIGTTHFYHHTANKKIEDYIDQYVEVVEKMEAWREGAISSFRNWYNREESYLLKGENAPIEFISVGNGSWRKRDRPEKDDKKIPFKADQCFTPTYIDEYLTEYVRLLRAETTWFRQAPHFCIIVKPISVRDGDSDNANFIPLGNLYVHVGMLQKKDEHPFFFHELVNKLLQDWFKTNGYLVAKNIAQGVGEHIPPSLLKEHLPRLNEINKRKNQLTGLIQLNKHKISWMACYKAAFGSDDGGLLHSFSDQLISYEDLTTGCDEREPDERATFVQGRILEVVERDKLAGFSLVNCKTIDEETKKRFLRTLNLRRCCLVLLLVLDRTPSEAKRREIHQHVNPIDKPLTEKGTTTSSGYLDRMFLIPRTNKLAYSTASDSERALIDSLRRFVCWPAPARGVRDT